MIARLLDAAVPLARLLDPETAHRLTVRALSAIPQPATIQPGPLTTEAFGLQFPSPVGLAAGFDKNAEAWPGLLALGAGFVEVGTMTPRPQAGNPRPRLFRLTEDRAAINRYGFANEGIEACLKRLADRRRAGGVVGINVGPNKDADDPVEATAGAVSAVAAYADYITVNVSSPNTPGLRDLQARGPLTELLAAADGARLSGGSRIPLLLKIAPDLDGARLDDIAEVVGASALDGLIVSNTTIDRPATLRSAHREETGGLSGRPLFDKATLILAEMRVRLGDSLPLIGVGGVEDGTTAYAKVRAGASLIQLYTALVFRGPGLLARIERGLLEHLRRDGFTHLADATGTGAADIVAAANAASEARAA